MTEVRKSQDVEKETSAAAAFARFVEQTSTLESLMQTPREDLLNHIEKFLQNPRHLPHVEMIVAAIQTQQLLGRFGVLYKLTRPVGSPSYNRIWKDWSKRAEEQSKELLKDVRPGEVTIALPPARLVDMPEWRSAGRIYLLEARVDVDPARDFVPAALSVRMELGEDNSAQMIDSSPKSETAVVAELAEEGHLVETTSVEAKGSAGVKAQVVSATMEAKSSDSVEVGQKFNLTRKLTAQRITSSAVANTARWQILRIADEGLDGGHTFLATVLVEGDQDTLNIAATAAVEFEHWGTESARLQVQRHLPKTT